MTKEELLEKAKRDYPVGTIFIGVDTTNKYELERFQTANDHWETSKRIIVHCKEKDGHGEYLYKEGVWAEIVSKPEVPVYPTDVKYQKGDKVKVLRKAKDFERGWQMVWIDSMSSKVGEVLTVKEDNGLEGVLMEESCLYPHFVLEKVEAEVAFKPSKDKPFYVVVTEENKDVLSKWRGGVALTAILNAGWITGLWENIGRAPSKEHNRIDSDNKNFGNEITFEQFLNLYPEYKEKVVEPVKTDVMKELTELPEKWCVKGGKELSSSGFRDWEGNSRGLCGDAKSYYHFNGWNYINYQATVKNGYTEITVYQFKRWVLKESDTLKVEDLVEGEIYFCKYDSNRYTYLFLYEGTGNAKMITTTKTIYSISSWNFLSKSYDFRKTTDEEKQWLQTCIKAGKFVSLEDYKGMLLGEGLLEEAKRRYPIGTNVKSLVASFKGVVKSHVCSSKGEEQVWFSADTCNVLVYHKGKWADVIKPAASSPVEGRLEIRKRKFIDWYSHNLPPHLAKRAIECFDPTYTSAVPEASYEYLAYGFEWSKTTEKHDFWSNLNYKIVRGEDIQSYGMGIQYYGMGIRDQILTPSQSYEPIEITDLVHTELIMLKTTTI